MANLKSEQLNRNLTLEIAYDDPLSLSKMIDALVIILGEDNCSIEKIFNKKIIRYNHDGKSEILLVSSITYLGGRHPIYKKRSQLKKWYKDVVDHYSLDEDINVRFIGMYHHKDNIVLAEFVKDSYLRRKMNSSAAHVFTNDLYQAMKEGIFRRTDRNKNKIVTIDTSKFKEYLDGELDGIDNKLFSFFDTFNRQSNFGGWLPARVAIPEMYENGWNKWKETEWPGWYLEYKVDKFIKEKCREDNVLYIGSSNKRTQEDFDLWFKDDNFLGDLKSSDVNKKSSPGNDQKNLLECLKKYGKFWYVIYEHETIKDSQINDYEATRFRANFIKEKNEWPKKKVFDELSYHTRMKNSVKFVRMYIIELNEINYKDILGNFAQGHQPNGDKRKPKFIINKSNIDNHIVYKYEFVDLNI